MNNSPVYLFERDNLIVFYYKSNPGAFYWSFGVDHDAKGPFDSVYKTLNHYHQLTNQSKVPLQIIPSHVIPVDFKNKKKV